jgi:hypothetical protein
MLRQNRFADLHRRLIACPGQLLECARHRFQRIEGMLRVLGPEATLHRGYAITVADSDQIIRTTAAARPKNESSHPRQRRRIWLGSPVVHAYRLRIVFRPFVWIKFIKNRKFLALTLDLLRLI